MNLFYNLPKSIINKIYNYDNTYKIIFNETIKILNNHFLMTFIIRLHPIGNIKHYLTYTD
jgi:hypothetical protein